MFKLIQLFLVSIFFWPGMLSGGEVLSTNKQDTAHWEMEIDPYYTNLGLYINLTDEAIPDLGDKSEREIYQDLLFRSHQPRFVLLEFSINPMPILGAAIRHNSEYFYQQAQVSDNVNIVEVLTAGFEEPYAVSLFVGNMVTYGENEAGKNKGFMGYLLSHGDKHLLNNEVVQDNWYEFEWKIKGTIVKQLKNLDWSFRVGGKWHANPYIADAVYMGIRRDHFDIEQQWLAFLQNSGVDIFFEFNQTKLAATQQRILLHKKYSIRKC